jgi:hypothetical protein
LGKLQINHLLHIMDHKGTDIYKGRIMFRPQPKFKMSERAIPTKNLGSEWQRKDRKYT